MTGRGKIKTEYTSLSLSTYDKRDAFSFEVRGYPDLSGNVPFRSTHAVIVGQLGRIAKGCDHFEHFRFRLVALTSRLMEQGFDRELLEKRVMRSSYQKKKDMVGKYKKEEEQFVNGCFERKGEKEALKKKQQEKKKEQWRKRKERKRQNKKENKRRKIQ